MGFILGGLTGEEYDRNYSDAQLLRRIVGYFRPHLGKMLFVALLLPVALLAAMTLVAWRRRPPAHSDSAGAIDER